MIAYLLDGLDTTLLVVFLPHRIFSPKRSNRSAKPAQDGRTIKISENFTEWAEQVEKLLRL
jgi:hypothetical protein